MVLYRRRILSATLLALALSATALRAGTIVFSNIDATACLCGAEVEGANSTNHESLAEPFIFFGNYLLSGAEARLFNSSVFDSTGVVNFFLYSNVSNNPGTLLGSLGSVTLSAGQEGVLSPSGPIPALLLQSGVMYWFVLTPGTADTFVTWEGQGLSPQALAFTPDVTGTSFWVSGGIGGLQFEIDGTPTAVPEPATISLCLVGIGAIGLMFKRRAA